MLIQFSFHPRGNQVSGSRLKRPKVLQGSHRQSGLELRSIIYYPHHLTSGVNPPPPQGCCREGSVVNSCSCREPRFNSQHPHDCSKLTVTPFLGDLTPPSGSTAPRTCLVHTHRCRQNTHTHKLKTDKSLSTQQKPGVG